jgi:hypothetical protein
MKKNTVGEKIQTPEGRVSFAHAFEPVENQRGKLIYEITLLIPKTIDITNIRNVVRKCVESVFPDKAKRPLLKNPIKDGDVPNSKGNIYDVYPGHWAIRAWSKQRPGIVAADAHTILVSASDFYSGCYARAMITPFIYDNIGNTGVSFFLGNVQKLRDGEPLGNAMGNPEDDFEPVASPGSDQVEYATIDDDLFG